MAKQRGEAGDTPSGGKNFSLGREKLLHGEVKMKVGYGRHRFHLVGKQKKALENGLYMYGYFTYLPTASSSRTC